MKLNYFHWMFAVAVSMSTSWVYSAELISLKEAKLPQANGSLKTRGITRGPAIKVSSPDLSAAEIKSPFDLKVLFESRGGNKVDPNAVKVSYLKSTEVDLTPRLQGAITAGGIDFSKAEVPPGEHAIKITVKDLDGRESSTIINLNIAK
jgi:hypothetical protein